MSRDIERRMRRSRLIRPSDNLERRMESLLCHHAPRARWWRYAIAATASCAVAIIVGLTWPKQDAITASLSPQARIVIRQDQLPKAFWKGAAPASNWDSWKVEVFVDTEKENVKCDG